MNKKTHIYGWIIPALIIVANAIAIMVCWNSLPETLLAHFDPEGYASGSMSRSTLIFYPVASAFVCAIIYATGFWISRRSNSNAKADRLRFQGLTFLTSGIALTIFSSTMVTLTQGTMPGFMFAEPVIMSIALIASIICLVKARKCK